ncbi:SDR family oxidoreductase [Nonomuraea sp. NPDC050394]|uniref:SDR family oxidoreductase n=1 Tax=Nonomuraea sp. NPDC050394 TaxID=3364363 RepID=UPI0037A6A06B
MNIALVAGATRGTGRGIAVQLGAAGYTVYCTGRSGGSQRSEMNRPETIEETAALVTAAGGTGIPVRVDHLDQEQVKALVERIERDHGQLDVLVNDVWGGDRLTEWNVPVWEHNLDNGLRLLRLAIDTHIITSHYALPLLSRKPGGLVVEVTDGTKKYNDGHYRLSLFYDQAKTAVVRLAYALSHDLREHGCAAVALTPGFLRSEAMLENFGVTEETWRDYIPKNATWAVSETPAFAGRAVAALAQDPDKMRWTGQSLDSGSLAQVYGFTDLDGSRPDVWRYIDEVEDGGKKADASEYR